MFNVLRRVKRRMFPQTYALEREIPPPSVNYNQMIQSEIDEYVRIFKDRACRQELPFFMKHGLKPGCAILDYGCGLGRIGYAASKYLTPDGAYFGYEPQEGARAFLKKAYSHLPNFHFDGKPLRLEEDYVAYVQHQRRTGGASGTEVDLSFVRRPIDIQYTSSVFTHMYEDAIVEVLKQINPLMAPTGICINTWLCIDDFAAYILRCGLADRTFPHKFGNMFAVSKESPLESVGYSLNTIRNIYDRASQDVIEILWGEWSGRKNEVTYIDTILSRPRRP